MTVQQDAENASRIRAVIVAYGCDTDLAQCLSALAEEPDCEVVVVDNASQSSTRALVTRHPRVRYDDPGTNLGFGRANNRGAAGFCGEYLFFLNPDAQVGPGAPGVLADFLDKHPHAGTAGPFVRNPDGTRQLSARRWPGAWTFLFHRYSVLTRLWPANPGSRAYLMSDAAAGEEPRAVDWLSGCALMVRREAFEAVGGFDERYFLFCEDTALCRALDLAGWARWYVPAAQVTHRVGRSAAERSVRLVYERHRSMWTYFRTYHPWRRVLAPVVLAGLGVRFAVYAVRALCSRHERPTRPAKEPSSPDAI